MESRRLRTARSREPVISGWWVVIASYAGMRVTRKPMVCSSQTRGPKGPPVERVLFETGRMAPTLFHGLTGYCHITK